MLDEIQRCPALLSWLQGLVDERRRMGDFVLTGSRQFELAHGLTQTLAGRGGYPPLYDRPVEPTDWLPAYVATYVERDVRQWLEVRDLTLFQRFVRMCAARTGQPLNLTALAGIRAPAQLHTHALRGALFET